MAAVLLAGGRGDPYGRCPCGRARLPVAACGGRGAAGGTTRGGCGTTWRLGCSGGALGGALPGSSTRSRMLGGTKRPDFSRTASGMSAAAGSAASIGAVGSAMGGASAAGAAAIGVSNDGASGGASTGGGAASSTLGASAGLAFLIRRGGPSVGAAGLGGSGAGAAAPFLPGAALPFAAVLTACSEKMSPFGRVMPRCLERRSTNWRATISSSVLDALFSSMPWFFFNSASTSWLVVLSSSATL